MYKHSTVVNNTLYVDGIDRLDLSRSCACGQSFRWHEDNGGFTAPALGRVVHARQAGDTLSIYPCAEGEAADWIHYFDLERDYAAIEERLSHDEQLKMCIPCATGIRVFNQDAFEALITFIISANNNIGRIAGIVERLCALCGERAELDGKEYFLFPKPDAIAAREESELLAIGAGYRAPYIKERKAHCGRIRVELAARYAARRGAEGTAHILRRWPEGCGLRAAVRPWAYGRIPR